MRLRLAVLIGLVLGNTLGLLLMPTRLAAAGSTGLVISEFESGYAGHSGDEFVELYNPTSADISLGKWTLAYHAAGATCTTAWTTKPVTTLGTIKAHGFYLLGSGAYAATADAKTTSTSFGLGDTAGSVRVVDNLGAVVDTVGWGSSNACAEGTSVAAASAGASLERLPGPFMEAAGNNLDSGDNSADFVVRPAPGPQTTLSVTEVAAVSDASSITYAAPELTEVGPVASSTQDSFIELINPTTAPIYLGGYTITADTGQFALPPAMLAAGAYLSLPAATSRLVLPTAGTVHLLDPSGAEINATAPWAGAVSGQTWSLMPDGWTWTTTTTPGAVNVETDPVVAAPQPTDGGFGGPVALASIQITELLPNPASPATDAAGEFVEFYNPNDVPVSLAGYMLKSGGSLSNKAVLGADQVPAAGYLAVYSVQTKLPLANDGSAVALFDPAGVQIGATINYGKATSGYAYALIDGTWAWTTTPTPAAGNVLTAPPIAPAAAAKAAAAKTTKAAKVTSPKATKAKAVKVAATKKPKAATKTSRAKSVLAAATTPANAPWLLWILTFLTIGFVSYEFRHDISDLYQRARRYFGASSTPSRRA